MNKIVAAVALFTVVVISGIATSIFVSSSLLDRVIEQKEMISAINNEFFPESATFSALKDVESLEKMDVREIYKRACLELQVYSRLILVDRYMHGSEKHEEINSLVLKSESTIRDLINKGYCKRLST